LLENLGVIWRHDYNKISDATKDYRKKIMAHDKVLLGIQQAIKDGTRPLKDFYKKLRTYGEEYSDITKSLKSADDEMLSWQMEAADAKQMNKEYRQWSGSVNQEINLVVKAALEKKYHHWLELQNAEFKILEGGVMGGIEIGAKFATYMREATYMPDTCMLECTGLVCRH